MKKIRPMMKKIKLKMKIFKDDTKFGRDIKKDEKMGQKIIR